MKSGKGRWGYVLWIWGLLFSMGGTTGIAAEYPSKPIEMVIPWPAGGRTDIATRVYAPYLEKNLGVPVVVINKVGGGGILGMSFVRDAKPDGYTISSGGMAMTNFQYQKPGNLNLWDYTWIARVYWTPQVLAVNVKSPYKSLKELMEYAKANPGKLRHGNTATGSTTHICSEDLARKFKLKFTQVPYKGEGDTVKGIGAGEVDCAFGLMLAFRPLVEDGKLKILGVADEKRNPLFPDIPTFREQGYEFLAPTWEAVHAPKGIPQNVYQKLSEASKKALNDPELIDKFGKIGMNISYQAGPEFTQWLKGYDKEIKELTYELGLEFKK
jgi:tripartite-type tricarboxylate transporter receptor subunit TctC